MRSLWSFQWNILFWRKSKFEYNAPLMIEINEVLYLLDSGNQKATFSFFWLRISKIQTSSCSPKIILTWKSSGRDRASQGFLDSSVRWTSTWAPEPYLRDCWWSSYVSKWGMIYTKLFIWKSWMPDVEFPPFFVKPPCWIFHKY